MATRRSIFEEVGQAIVVVGIRVAEDDRVDVPHAPRPQRRRDDPAADARVAHPRQGFQQLALAVARDARDAEDLAGPQREVDPLHPLDPRGVAHAEAARLQQRWAGARRGARRLPAATLREGRRTL